MKVAHADDSQPEQQPEQQSEPQAAPQPDEQAEGEDEEGADEEPSEPVPKGTTNEILRWVAGDKQRAQAALDVERANDRPRSSLISQLTRIAR